MPDLELIHTLVIFFVMFVAAGLGAPIPEELAIVAAGLYTGTHPEHGPSRWLMLPVCLLGVIISDVLLYGIGRRFGTRLLEHRWLARLLPAEKRLRIEGNFQQYGVSILLFGRLLPGIRAPLFVTAGMMRVSFAQFLVADGIGAVLGNSLLYFLAFWFGDQFQELVKRIRHDLETARPLIVLGVLVVVALYFLVHFLRRPVTTGDPKELPLIGTQVAAHIHHDKGSKELPAVRPPKEPVADDRAARVEDRRP